MTSGEGPPVTTTANVNKLGDRDSSHIALNSRQKNHRRPTTDYTTRQTIPTGLDTFLEGGQKASKGQLLPVGEQGR